MSSNSSSFDSVRKTRVVRFGPTSVEFPSTSLQPLVNSTELLHLSQLNSSALFQTRIDHDGYIFLRNLIPRTLVLEARSAILQYMAESGVLETSNIMGKIDATMAKNAPYLFNMEGFDRIAMHPSVKGLVECPELYRFFQNYLFGGETARTFDYKWIRAIGKDQYTGVHCDKVYMGRGTNQLYTVWIPLGDITVEQGTLAICAGSNTSESYHRIRSTYGQLDVDRDKTEGWLSKDPFEISSKYGGHWATADFKAGDVLIFSIYTLHASTTNITNSYRLSCDVRFLRQRDEADNRWILCNDDQESNDVGTGHSSHGKETPRSMESARNEWGI